MAPKKHAPKAAPKAATKAAPPKKKMEIKNEFVSADVTAVTANVYHTTNVDMFFNGLAPQGRTPIYGVLLRLLKTSELH